MKKKNGTRYFLLLLTILLVLATLFFVWWFSNWSPKCSIDENEIQNKKELCLNGLIYDAQINNSNVQIENQDFNKNTGLSEGLMMFPSNYQFKITATEYSEQYCSLQKGDIEENMTRNYQRVGTILDISNRGLYKTGSSNLFFMVYGESYRCGYEIEGIDNNGDSIKYEDVETNLRSIFNNKSN